MGYQYSSKCLLKTEVQFFKTMAEIHVLMLFNNTIIDKVGNKISLRDLGAASSKYHGMDEKMISFSSSQLGIQITMQIFTMMRTNFEYNNAELVHRTECLVVLPTGNHTFLGCVAGVSGQFCRPIVDIFGKIQSTKVLITRSNKPNVQLKHTRKGTIRYLPTPHSAKQLHSYIRFVTS